MRIVVEMKDRLKKQIGEYKCIFWRINKFIWWVAYILDACGATVDR